MANVQQKEKENLEKVTDYVEERQLDADRMAAAISSLGSDEVINAEADKAAREWASVKVKAEDVDFIVGELEVTKETAEATLKQHQGNVVLALRKLLA